MKIVNMEVLTQEESDRWCRLARIERRERKRRLHSMTALDALAIDLSVMKANAAQKAKGGLPSPKPKEEIDDPHGVVALNFASKADGKPVLITYSYEPSKRFENDLRYFAKQRGFKLGFFRLIPPLVILHLQPKKKLAEEHDSKFLTDMGITW